MPCMQLNVSLKSCILDKDCTVHSSGFRLENIGQNANIAACELLQFRQNSLHSYTANLFFTLQDV